MNFLDVRTVIFSQLITDAVCTAVLGLLWWQNRRRFGGMLFWVGDFIFQTVAVLLISLRGVIPDWLSLGAPDPLVIAGSLLGLWGLERFVGKKLSQTLNFIFLAGFIFTHFYFIYAQNNLDVRNLSLSLGLLVFCFQCAWLMLSSSGDKLIHTSKLVGWVFALFCLTSLIRIFILLANPLVTNDFFQTGLYDRLILVVYQVLLIFLTFGLALLVNRRLLRQVQTQEEKFTKAFHSSPYAILITRLADGLILDVNHSFEKTTGYLSSKVIGKTTLDLNLWVNDGDRQTVVSELSAHGDVQGLEFQFRTKSGQVLTGLFYAEILTVENEQLILSSINDISERKRAEEIQQESQTRYRSLFENMLNGFAYCQMLFDGERPLDFIYLDVNRAFETLTGLKNVVGKRVSEVIPGILASDPELIATYGRVALTGQPEVFETYVEALKMWFAISVYGVKKGFFVAVFDVITERKQAEAALRDSENQYRELIQNANSAILRWRRDGTILYFNEYAQNFFGYTADEILDRNVNILVPETESTGADLSSLVQDILDYPERFVNVVNENICRDGRRAWMAWTNKAILDENGQVSEILAVGVDITERKQAEQALLDSELKYRHTLEAMFEGCQIIGFDWRYLYLNEAAEKHNRRPNEELLGQKYMDMWPGIESTHVFRVICSCMQDRQPQSMENEFQFPDGSLGWFELRIYPMPEGIVIFSNDITEQKQVAQTIASLARFPSENPNPVLRITHEGYLLYANEAAFFLLADFNLEVGKPAPVILSDPSNEVFDLQKVKEIEISCGERTFSVSIAPTPGNEYVNLYARDITSQKLAEKALWESEDKFKYVFDYSVVGKSITLPDGTMQPNYAFWDMLGYSEQEIREKSWRETTHPEDIEITQKEIDAMLSGQKESARFLKRYLHRNGSIVWADVSTSLRRDTSGNPLYFITTVLDITERKQADEELKRSNAELEQFAYVASHDLQEPLRMVSSYVQLLQRRYQGKLDQDADEFIGFAVDGAERMRRLINDLLAYSRIGTRAQQFTPTKCEDVLEQSVGNLQLAIQENQAEVTHDPLPEVLGDETQLVQLFQNLIANAIKFHGKKKPKVHISASLSSRSSLPINEAGGSWGLRGDVWLFSVHDNGIGIDPRYAERIFIIFQRLNDRTKYPGTGIGLALCRKIVQRHGGQIWVESNPGAGATFFFTLPPKGDK